MTMKTKFKNGQTLKPLNLKETNNLHAYRLTDDARRKITAVTNEGGLEVEVIVAGIDYEYYERDAIRAKEHGGKPYPAPDTKQGDKAYIMPMNLNRWQLA